MKTRGETLQNVDFWLVIIYLFLVGFGLLNIYSSSLSSAKALNNISFSLSTNYGRQLIFIGVSFLLAFVILMTEASIFERFSYLFYIMACLLLILVLFIGKSHGGSKSWIQISSFSLQPAEFAKFATALAISYFLSKNQYIKISLGKKFLAFSFILFPVLLILLQPDAGSAIVFLALFFLFFREGFSMSITLLFFYLIIIFVVALIVNKYIILAFVLGLLVLTYFLVLKQRKYIFKLIIVFAVTLLSVFSIDFIYDNVLKAHQKDRIELLLGKKVDPKGVGYNVEQSKIAFGSGGLLGKGYLQGTQTKFDFIPEQQTDFIFCTVGEEFGFIGTFTIVLLFFVLIIRIIILSERQRSVFSRNYGYCVAALFFVHVFINVAMAIGLLPVIGIPLPFFSYGGSSLMAFTMLLFIFIKMDAYKYTLLG